MKPFSTTPMYVNMPVPWSVDMGHGTGTPWLATGRSSKIDWEGQPTRVTRAPGFDSQPTMLRYHALLRYQHLLDACQPLVMFWPSTNVTCHMLHRFFDIFYRSNQRTGYTTHFRTNQPAANWSSGPQPILDTQPVKAKRRTNSV